MRRLFCIVDIVNGSLDRAETLAQQADEHGDGTGTFAQGMPLSVDGGDTITHRAANSLAGLHDESVYLEEADANDAVALYDVNSKDGNGTVRKREGGKWVEIGTGDLMDLALQDTGLERYQTDTLV